ncbi:two-component regulator propeller domain-containing protein [Paucibacter sp. APW11]|uniref:histidine kinase n=1 Tax=Roseateles aquae TaxID=3077235 RepID=A0ABU3PEZ9_9BURK|nr:two-component regulator propeller domain-containing protein [Paucibacter sp. APW11]MDT9001109.1 two-component regulator propeller domain-containing protein [Paucibacter sp. APW11]
MHSLGLTAAATVAALQRRSRVCGRVLRTAWRLGLALLLTLALNGTATAAYVASLRFNALGTEQGLPDSSAVTMLQDRRGLMWIGTANGLARYDGRRFKHFAADPDDEHALAHALVSALLEDESERLWIGTSAGLHRMDLRSETLQRIPMPADWSPQNRRIFAMVRVGARLWVACRGGLLRYELSSGAYELVLASADPLNPLRLGAMVADRQGGLYISQGARVLHLSAQGQQDLTLDLAQGRPGEAVGLTIRSMLLDEQGRLWLGTALGLRAWQLGGADAKPLDELQALKLPQQVVFSLLRDEAGSIWAAYGSGGGLLRLRDQPGGGWETEFFRHHDALPHSLSASSVASLYQDSSGVLWIGTWGGGISLADLRSGGFRQYLHVLDDPDSLSSDGITAVALDGSEQAWLGSYGGGLNRVNLRSGSTERIAQSQSGARLIKTLLLEAPGRLWIGGDDGLRLFDTVRRRSEVIALGNTSPAGASIAALLHDRQGVLWIASAGGLYRRLPDGRLLTYRAVAGQAGALSHDTVDCLLEDHHGRIWVGTKGGLHLWDPASEGFVQPLQPSAELKNPAGLSVFSLREDAKGRIWLGTAVGLFQLLPQGQGWRLQSWRQLPGMPRGWVNTMQEDLHGALWLGHEQGLVHVLPDQSKVRFYPGLGGHFDGGFGFNATARDAHGRLYFGSQGLLAFKPDELRESHAAPRVLLSDLRVFNQSLLPSEAASEVQDQRSSAPLSLRAVGIDGLLHQARQVRLSHRETMVSFEFSALHFYSVRHNRYAWKLEGFDTDWIEGKPGEGLATYTNLDPGSYQLRARAAGPDGSWSGEDLVLAIEVLPPFWRALWFRLLAGVALLAALAALYRWRLRLMWQAQRRLEKEVAARTAEAVQEAEHAERQRQQAEAARHDISLLSEIGRELTGLLDGEAILELLYRRVQQLMEADIFAVGLLRAEEGVIAFDYCMQGGMAFEPYQRALASEEQPAVQCVLQARELIIEKFPHDNRIVRGVGGAQRRLRLVDGSEPPPARSALFVPMMLKGQVMGVISVLSQREGAYDGSHLDKLRTLGAYAAVALDKAEAYHRLKLTQTQLVAQEKLAALGALVAGVAHELNTPIGNSLLVASTLRDASEEFVQQARSGGLRRSELERYCDNASASSSLLLRSLSQAAELISSFKQLAVDQTSDQRRPFELRQLCEELALTFASRLRREEHRLELAIEPGIAMDSFPGPLGQVLGNLIMNALVHAFEGRKHGLLQLQGQRLGSDRVQISFRDDGRGIAAEHLGRIFDPFFTTKLGQGGSGLGLHISYTIVSSLLGGSIRVSSSPGQGACFTIELPLVAPFAVEPPADAAAA